MIETNDKKRLFINVLRGFAIFLMLWGHVIQYCTQGSFDFFENIVFKTIYTFHMPFFMIISGYLFFYSFQKRDTKELIIHRIQPLLWTIVFCSAFNWIITTGIITIYNGSFINSFQSFVLSNYKSLWFLWSVIASSLGVALICKNVKQIWLQILLLILWGIVVYALPCGQGNLYVYPYFVIGFYFAQYKITYGKNRVLELLVKIFSIIGYVVSLFFFEKKHYIYTTGLYDSQYSFLENIGIDIFRWFIGLVGCIAVISIIELLFNTITLKAKKQLPLSLSLSKVGEKSLQIYALSVSLLSFWLNKLYSYVVIKIFGYNILTQNIYLYNFVFTPLIAIAYLLSIYFIIKIFERIKFSKILFGK